MYKCISCTYTQLNVILFNLNEPENPIPSERREQDLYAARLVLREVSATIDTDNIAVDRLGRFKAEVECKRPLRIKLKSVTDAHRIMKYAKNLRKSTTFSNFKIALDKTPRQLNYLKKNYLKKKKSELESRIQQGGKDLIIKYRNGIPTIKNLN